MAAVLFAIYFRKRSPYDGFFDIIKQGDNMDRKPYSAGAVKFAFWFIEMKKVCTLLAAGMTIEQIKAQNDAENIFSASSPERARTIMSTLTRRLAEFDEVFIQLFMHSDVVGQKQLCLIACMCNDTLFFDFVYDVIRSRLILGIDEYSESDIRRFWAEKQVQSEKIASLTDATRNRLARTYKQYLLSAGVTDAGKGTRKIFKPIISAEIENWLRKNALQPVLAALTGE